MFPRSRSKCKFADLHHRQGLTLMELLVVLVILAIVATIAVQSLQPKVETARFEQTRKTLEEVKIAVCGDPRSRQADGSPLINGFVADIGRTPLPGFANPGPPTQPDSPTGPALVRTTNRLNELWDSESYLATQYPYQFRPGPKSPIDCSDIQLPCGWRGPYLQLPIGQKELTDPWARPFKMELDENQNLASLEWEPVGDFETPLLADLTTGLVSVSGTIHFGDHSSGTVQSVLLVPDPEHSTTELKVLSDLDPRPNSFLFEDVPVGLRAIRVVADGKVFTKYIEVPHGGLTFLFNASQHSGGTP